jgi:hypothetical protein
MNPIWLFLYFGIGAVLVSRIERHGMTAAERQKLMIITKLLAVTFWPIVVVHGTLLALFDKVDK